MAELPVIYPLGGPTVSGTTVTVDTMLNQPTRIDKMISDLALQRFIAGEIFSTGGGVSGGAVLYDLTQINEIYTSRDVEQLVPGGQYPNLTAERLAPSVAYVESWGGKHQVTDEARLRNDSVAFARMVRNVANTISRKSEQRAIAVLEAANLSGRNVTPFDTSTTWADSLALAPSTAGYNPKAAPHYTIDTAQKNADVEELGIQYDTLLVNPNEASFLRLYYNFNGQDGVTSMLNDYGIGRLIVSNRVTAGTGYLLQAGSVGQIRTETPLKTEVWRDADTRSTWFGSYTSFVPFVDNQYAFVKLTGLAA